MTRSAADAERLATLAERRDLKASIMRSAGSPEDNIGFLLRLLREAEAERDAAYARERLRMEEVTARNEIISQLERRLQAGIFC